MLHVYDTNDDDNNEYANANTRKNRLDFNGILVTSEDLNGSFQNSSSAGSRTIYIKPLPSENDMSNSSLLTEKKRLPKAQHSAVLPFPNNTDNVNTLTPTGFSPKSTQNTNKSSAKIAGINNNYVLISPSHSISSNHNSYSPTTNINYDHENNDNRGEYNNTITSHHSTIPTSNNERQNSQPEQRQHRHHQQHHRHVNRSSFNRHSVLRRSLGAVTIFSYPNTSNQHSSDSDISHKSYTNNKDNVINNNNSSSKKSNNNSHLIDHLSSQSPSSSLSSSVNTRNDESINSYNDSVLYQRHIFCLSNLPVFEDLGFILKPFPSNRLKFRGFRLLIDKSAHPEHLSRTDDDMPLRSGDIIVTVNRNKLSNMSETEALQYVLNAFKDAQQYTIEVGIRRPSLSLSSPLSKNSCITESSSPSSTLLPKKLFNRQKSDSGYSASIGMNVSSNPHQPRRRCTEYVSGEFTTSEQHSLINKEEKNVDSVPIPNTRSSNLHRLSLMDYPDSPRLCSSSQFPFGDSNNPLATDSGCSTAGGGYFDSINTAMLASSLSTNLTDNGFVTIRRPKHPGNLTTIDNNDHRYSIISGSESPHRSSLSNVKKSSMTKIPLKNQNNDNMSNTGDNSNNSRTLTPNTEGSTVSPGMPRRSLNVSKKDPNAFNTRTIGQTMHIQLTKMLNNGLGFTLTSRDTQTQSSQISELVYVKKILPNGAAIQDGRLMIGDRLLAVDGQDVQSLNQVLLQLRSLEPGEQVDLLISRHTTTTGGDDTDLNTTRKSSLPLHPFISLTYEYKLPLANSNQSDKHSSPALGINFKWSNDIPYVSSTSSSSPTAKPPNVQYSPVPGLYIDSLLPESIITSGNRITVQPGDRLVGINGESVDGMNAKNIVIRLKKILSQCHEQNVHSSGQSSSTFSLTVHRYKQDDSQRSGKAATLRPTTLPPRRNKSSHPEELENNQQKHQDGYSSLSFTLSDNRRRVLNRSDSMSSEYGSRSMHHRVEQRSSFRIPQLLNDNDEDSSQLPLPFSSSTSSPVANYPSSRNLSVPSNRNFMREGFGRRSVSEKRHGHVDASQYSFFQTNILPNRYKMPEDVDKQYSTMPTTRRLKMHKARLAAAAAAAANSHTPTSTTTFPSGNGNQLTGTIGSGSGPLKALHSLSAIPPQSPVYTSYQDPDTVDIEHQSDQPSILRNRKQNNSFRHAVDRSFIPPTTTTTTTTTTGDNNFSSNKNDNYANTLNMRSIYNPHPESPNVYPSASSSSPPPPPLPPHRPRSGSANRDKLIPNIGHNNNNDNSNKIKHTSPLAQPSSRSSSITTHKSTRPRSKSRSEGGAGAGADGSHTQPVTLIQPSALQPSSMNSLVSSEQKHTNNNSNNKSGLSALKNIFKIGTSKTVSEVNDSSASMVKSVNHHHSKTSSQTASNHLLLQPKKKQQLRRSSVPENQLAVNQTPSKLTTEIHTTSSTTTNAISSNNSNDNNYINPNSLPMNKVAHPYISSGHYSNSPKSAVHINSHTVSMESPLRKVISPRVMMNSSHNSSISNNNNTVHINPYCPPPDINPPPLPPRVSYTTPAMITTHHSKPVKYRPLPEPPENPPPPPMTTTTTTTTPVSVSKQKHGTRRKSLANSITPPNTSVNVNQSTTTTTKITTTSIDPNSPSCFSSPMHIVESTSVVTNMIKKSNSYHDHQYHHQQQQENRTNHRQNSQDNNIIIPSNTTTTAATRRHRQRQHSSNQNAVPSERCAESQTPAVYINSQHMSKQMKKITPSPHRSRSTHSRVSSSNNNNNTNSNKNNNNNVTTSPESAGHYQTPYAAPSHSSTVSSTRRHLRSQQEARKSEGYSNHNRRIQVTMQEASLIAIQPIDKLITPKRSIHR